MFFNDFYYITCVMTIIGNILSKIKHYTGYCITYLAWQVSKRDRVGWASPSSDRLYQVLSCSLVHHFCRGAFRGPPPSHYPRSSCDPICRPCGPLQLHSVPSTPGALTPGVQRTWHLYLLSLRCHKICLLAQGNGLVVHLVTDKGGGSIYLYNSLARILHLLRNFAIFGNAAQINTFSNIRNYKIITVQISQKLDKPERRLICHSGKT